VSFRGFSRPNRFLGSHALAAIRWTLTLAFGGGCVHSTAAQPAAVAEADRLLAQGDYSAALLWTAAAMKADPQDSLLRWRALRPPRSHLSARTRCSIPRCARP
jgi:hypothetical protein